MDINQTDYQNSIQKNKNSLTENFPNLSYLNIEINKRNANFPFPNQSYKIQIQIFKIQYITQFNYLKIYKSEKHEFNR